jgi:hypothetical protein
VRYPLTARWEINVPKRARLKRSPGQILVTKTRINGPSIISHLSPLTNRRRRSHAHQRRRAPVSRRTAPPGTRFRTRAGPTHGGDPRECSGGPLTTNYEYMSSVHGAARVCDMNRAPVRDSWFPDSHQSPEMRCVSSPSYGAAVGFSHHLDSHSPHDGAAAKLEQGRWPGLRG